MRNVAKFWEDRAPIAGIMVVSDHLETYLSIRINVPNVVTLGQILQVDLIGKFAMRMRAITNDP